MDNFFANKYTPAHPHAVTAYLKAASRGLATAVARAHIGRGELWRWRGDRMAYRHHATDNAA